MMDGLRKSQHFALLWLLPLVPLAVALRLNVDRLFTLLDPQLWSCSSQLWGSYGLLEQELWGRMSPTFPLAALATAPAYTIVTPAWDFSVCPRPPHILRVL